MVQTKDQLYKIKTFNYGLETNIALYLFPAKGKYN